MVFPPAQDSEPETGLTFTDILFGIVIGALFMRLANANGLSEVVQLQLVVGAVVVLGSWIGFRRSLSRSTYELKFFNLPLARFVIDQLMVLLYFRMAILTPADPKVHVDAGGLAHDTLVTLIYVFLLYAAWDVLGLWMARARQNPWLPQAARKYPNITAGWPGLLITLSFLVMFGLLFALIPERNLDEPTAVNALIAMAFLLVMYRFVKEARTSWRLP